MWAKRERRECARNPLADPLHQQQPELGEQQDPPVSVMGFIAATSGVQAAPSVAHAASPA